MINAMVHAFKAIYLRSFVSIPSVICRNTGITPRGSIKVNSEVKHNVKYTNICHDGGCVVINEMKRDTHEWTTPLNALNELLEHEQYISRQVNTFLILCWNVSMSFHSFISGLYADRIYVSTAFMELLRILAKENERKLPYF